MTPFAVLDIARAAQWLGGVEFADWPQQHRLADGAIRPSMATDLAWKDFGENTETVALAVMQEFAGCKAAWRALSVVMPGHSIPTHQDQQPDYWLCRVHVPLMTNDYALFIVNDLAYNMKLGQAYRVDTREHHSVVNAGPTPRVHLMIDIHK